MADTQCKRRKPATDTQRHPVLGYVPICKTCKDRYNRTQEQET